MTFVAVLLALVLDQARRPGADAVWHGPMRAWTAWVQRQFDAGHPRQGWLVWGLAVGVPVLAVTGIYLALAAVSGLLAFAWTVAVLYATLGFRQFSHHFTAIRAALEPGDEARARALFAEWSGAPAVDWPREELLRRVIAQAVLCSHRHVLGVLGWFVVFAGLGLGPAGAVLYRAASWLAQQWPLDAPRAAAVSEAVARATARAWCGIDALPARLTVLGFAVVGHFEEALERWRAHATAWWEPSDALLLSVAGGAMQIRLWPRAPADEGGRAEGAAPQLAHLASTVGLVWRSVVLWLLVLALALLARIF